jgi:hypothetical protein
MRMFLFEGFWNADYFDQLGFDSLGFRLGRGNSPDAEPVTAALPDSAAPMLPASAWSARVVTCPDVRTCPTTLQTSGGQHAVRLST